MARSASSIELCEAVLERQGVPESVCEEMQELLADVKDMGIRQPPAAKPAPDAPLPLTTDAPPPDMVVQGPAAVAVPPPLPVATAPPVAAVPAAAVAPRPAPPAPAAVPGAGGV